MGRAAGVVFPQIPPFAMNQTSRPRSLRRWYPLLAILAAGVFTGVWIHFKTAHGSAGHGVAAAHGDHETQGSHAAATEHAGHEDHASVALSLNAGSRWETDQPLRRGMERIRAAAGAVLAARAGGNVSIGETKAMTETITNAVMDIVANCKLVPAADATLHVIITDLLSGAGLLSEDPASTEGFALIDRALRRYPEYFEHPGWNPALAAMQ